MNKVYSFGCSHSWRIQIDEEGNYAKPYGDWIAEWLGMDIFNFSQPASGNDFIFNKMLKQLGHIQKDDIVIVQLTHFSRNNFYDVETKEKSFGCYHKIGKDTDWMHPINKAWLSIYEYIIPQTIINIFELGLYIERVIGAKFYIFAFEDWRKPYELENQLPFWLEKFINLKNVIKFGEEKFLSLGEYGSKHYLTTLTDTGECEDGHMSSDSHKIVGELILNWIKENE